jgi:hypothetical protein
MYERTAVAPVGPSELRARWPANIAFGLSRERAMIPKICEMPDLGELPQLTGTMLLAVVFGKESGMSPRAAAVRKNLGRLVDKAVRRYQAARAHLIAQIDEMSASDEEKAKGRWITLFGFVDELEDCLLTVRRLMRFLEHMQSDCSAPTRDKIKKKLTEVNSKGLPQIRDAFEHLTEQFAQLGIEESAPVMIAVDAVDERIFRVGSRTFSFIDLANLVRALHAEVVDWINPQSGETCSEI